MIYEDIDMAGMYLRELAFGAGFQLTSRRLMVSSWSSSDQRDEHAWSQSSHTNARRIQQDVIYLVADRSSPQEKQ